MDKDEEIRETEQRIIATGRALATGEIHDLGLMRELLQRLDELQSPLPSREELRDSHSEGWKRNGGEFSHAIAEWHWVKCLRWVEGRADMLARAVDARDLREWANELEGRK